jgi:hypothetical protein
MSIKYSIGLEDIIAFNIHFNDNQGKRRLFNLQYNIIGTILLLAVGTALWLILKNIIFLFVYALFSILMPFLLTKYGVITKKYTEVIAKKVKLNYEKGFYSTSARDTEIEIHESEIIIKNDVVNSKYRFDSIQKLEILDDHLFIFFNKATALIIPRKTLIGISFDDLTNILVKEAAKYK